MNVCEIDQNNDEKAASLSELKVRQTSGVFVLVTSEFSLLADSDDSIQYMINLLFHPSLPHMSRVKITS